MNDTWPDLSGSIPPKIISALREIHETAAELKVPFFVVGATARDIILEHQHGLVTPRATLDLDVAVMLDRWDLFIGLKRELLSRPSFTQDPKQQQRIWHQGSLPVDIIPFGPIADETGTIAWPPTRDIRMRVLGFRECYEHASQVKIGSNPDLLVHVVSLAGLAMLKLISWNDDAARRRKDAADLFFILRSYLDAGNLDRVFGEENDAMEQAGYDFDLASAYLTGRDIARMIKPKTIEVILEILDKQATATQGHAIVLDILQSDLLFETGYERVAKYFDMLINGLRSHLL
jgi:predicted nucleotidyltransferase